MAEEKCKCPGCKAEFSVTFNAQELSMKGKNVICPVCRAILWVSLIRGEGTFAPSDETGKVFHKP